MIISLRHMRKLGSFRNSHDMVSLTPETREIVIFYYWNIFSLTDM